MPCATAWSTQDTWLNVTSRASASHCVRKMRAPFIAQQPIERIGKRMTSSQTKTESDRLTPAAALARCAKLFGLVTGAKPDGVLSPTRGSRIEEITRHLVVHFLLEVERYEITRLAAAMPGKSKGTSRHWSSLKNNHKRGWDYRDAPPIDDFIRWAAAHWREPISRHEVALTRRRTAFLKAIKAMKAKSPRLSAEAVTKALTDASLAASTRVTEPKPRARKTAVPVFDEPAAMTILRMSPAFQRPDVRLTCEPAPGGGHFIRIAADASKDAAKVVNDVMRAAARLLFIDAGFEGEQRHVAHTQAGWVAGLKLAPAAIAALVAILGAGPRASEPAHPVMLEAA